MKLLRIAAASAGFSLLACSAAAVPQVLDDKAAVKLQADEIMKSIGKGDVSGGFAVMSRNTTLGADLLLLQQKQTEAQLAAIKEPFGAPIGYEFVSETSVGQSLQRYVYLAKHEKMATRWGFTYYRGSQGWTLISFGFDDKPQCLLPTAFMSNC